MSSAGGSIGLHASREQSATTEQQKGAKSDANPASTSKAPLQQKKRQHCRFYLTKKGCRAGEDCPFLHDASRLDQSHRPDAKPQASKTTQPHHKEVGTASTSRVQAEPGQAPSSGAAVRRLPPWGQPPVDQHRVVQKPVPKAASQDPRGFQIGQIKRRFNAKEESRPEGVTELLFDMTPSDPDFPFEIDALKCSIKLYSVFPMKPPSLRVSNKEMERGYQVNVEKGFDAIWRQAAHPTLLGAMKELDKKLEQLLTAQKAEVIKIVAPQRTAAPNVQADLPREPEFINRVNVDKAENATATSVKLPKPAEPTVEQRAKAQERRENEVRILEHRLGRDSSFSKQADGTIFTLPIEPRKRESLPSNVQSVKSIQFYVPLTYDLDPCSIELLGVEGEAVKNIEAAFLKRSRQASESTLLAHVNFLAANMHTMAAQPIEAIATPIKEDSSAKTTPPQPVEEPSAKDEVLDTDKSHVKIIARPPEWSVPGEDNDETDSSEEDYSSFSGTESEAGEEGEKEAQDDKSSSTLRERGIMLSFPLLDLHNIELLELQSINLAVKCDRCKEVTSISNISNNILADPPQMRSERCKKCAIQFSVGFRHDIMHANSIRAGYLDLEGCTPLDLLTCPFSPTCSQCSTVHPPVSAVRGDAAMAICRECHARLSFTIKETKFLRISASAPLTVGTLPRKKPKDTLGIVAGTELPRSGRCQHYAKSHRWFRFSCCDKVYACDRCHDAEQKDHVQEFANRMICGFCSREQNYRPEHCSFCRRVLTGRKGRGFWEGGKGTRDPKKMSRKDPRKYKRRGAGAVKKNLKEKYET